MFVIYFDGSECIVSDEVRARGRQTRNASLRGKLLSKICLCWLSDTERMPTLLFAPQV